MSLRNLAVAFLAALLLSTSGCGRGSGKTNLAFISNNPHGFWAYAERGCEDAVAELNGKGFNIALDFRRPAAGGGMAEQQKIIEDLLVKGFKGIAISPSDPANLASFLKSKVGDKMTVLAVDNDVSDGSARKLYLGTNNYEAGRAAGALVKKVMPDGGKIAIFVGVNDATNAIERRQGVLDYLAGKDQKEMTDRTPLKANTPVGKYLLVDTKTDDEKDSVCRENAEGLLGTDPDIGCLIGLWEYNPPALLQAVRNFKGAKKPFIVAFDENFQTMDGIKSEEIVGSVAQNPYKFGYDSIKILAHLAKGDESVLKEYKMDEKKRIYVDFTVVTPDGAAFAGLTNVEKVDDFYAKLKKLKAK